MLEQSNSALTPGMASDVVMSNIVSVLNETWGCQAWMLLRRTPSSWMITHVLDERSRVKAGDVILDTPDGEFCFSQGVVNLYTPQTVTVQRPLEPQVTLRVMGSIFHRILNEDGSVFGAIWGVSSRRLSHAKMAAMPMLGLISEMVMMNYALCERAIEAQNRVVQAEIEANTDPLTGVLNLRGWNARIKQELARSKRTHSPLSLVVVDIDEFKHVNDMCGHSKGNEILVACAQLLRSNVRSHDVVARIGGDDFAILACDTKGESAKKMAAGLVMMLKKNGISCSAGTSEIERGSTWDEAMKRAELQLHVAKRALDSDVREPDISTT